MSITDLQKIDRLFKASERRSDHTTGRDYFAEGTRSQNVLSNDVWIEDLPTTCPLSFSDTHLQSSGIVQVLIDVQMDPIPGSEGAFAHSDPNVLSDIIPSSFGSGYQYQLKDHLGGSISLGVGDWIFDSQDGTLRFYNPSGAPQDIFTNFVQISCYKYIGLKNLSNLALAGASIKPHQQIFELDGSGYVELDFEPINSHHVCVFVDGGSIQFNKEVVPVGLQASFEMDTINKQRLYYDNIDDHTKSNLSGLTSGQIIVVIYFHA